MVPGVRQVVLLRPGVRVPRTHVAEPPLRAPRPDSWQDGGSEREEPQDPAHPHGEGVAGGEAEPGRRDAVEEDGEAEEDEEEEEVVELDEAGAEEGGEGGREALVEGEEDPLAGVGEGRGLAGGKGR